ncbi:hypothetical protein PAL_GLEAN10018502 [Pteropus alecto]|uniref:Uncharacterized protein n=1 Tax=Pteropus alecto TaxID=9402 RepID=L5KY59_PTEAL|nr:hypothetical protein PAL_GLEAN10018502 [Pteropus alecto]
MREAPASGGVGRGEKRVALDCPRVLWIKDLGGSAPHRAPPIPKRGTHLQRPSRPSGQQDQCQTGQHRDPARGTECAAVPVGSAAPSLCQCRRRRRRVWWRPRSHCSECSLSPLPRKLTEQERGGGAPSPASQLIRSARLGTRERPLAEPPGSCTGRGPRPGAHRCSAPATPAPRVVPGAVGGRIWGQERDGAGAGKGDLIALSEKRKGSKKEDVLREDHVSTLRVLLTGANEWAVAVGGLANV